MKSKYIFVDIDGTLLDNRIGIPKSAIQAICEARNMGHKVFICSGRAKSEISDSLLNIGFDGCIYSSGTAIEVEGKLILMKQINSDDLESIISFAEKRNVGCALEGYHALYFNSAAEEYFRSIGGKENSVNFQNPNSFMDVDKFLPIKDYDKNTSIINKISLFSDSISPYKDLSKLLKSDFKMLVYDEDNSSEIIHAEITLAHISKATGIDYVLEHYSDSIENTVCFGDSLNDLEMVEHCKIGIAMGNGIDRLKRIADHITDSVDNDGLFNGFKKYKLIA